jgi:undecaprenyl pyrophosphate phosphatase UppP
MAAVIMLAGAAVMIVQGHLLLRASGASRMKRNQLGREFWIRWSIAYVPAVITFGVIYEIKNFFVYAFILCVIVVAVVGLIVRLVWPLKRPETQELAGTDE